MREFINPIRLSAMSDEEVERELYKRVLVDHIDPRNIAKIPLFKLREFAAGVLNG